LDDSAAGRLAQGEVVIRGRTHDQTVRRDTTLTRFTDPRWSRRSEDEVAELLGENAIRELCSFAGLPGDYALERLFGATGKGLADAIWAHDRKLADGLESSIAPFAAVSASWPLRQ
jgi:hypothetical protein